MKKRSYLPLLIIAAVVIVAAAALLIYTREQSLDLPKVEPENVVISVFTGKTGEYVKVSSAEEKQALLDMLSRVHTRHVLSRKYTYPNDDYLLLTLNYSGGEFRGFHFDLAEGSVYSADRPQSRIADPEELLSYFSNSPAG